MAGVCALRTSGRSSVIVGDGAVDVEAEADGGELFGSHAEQVTTRE